MSDLNKSLVDVGDYFKTATNLRTLVKGHDPIRRS